MATCTSLAALPGDIQAKYCILEIIPAQVFPDTSSLNSTLTSYICLVMSRIIFRAYGMVPTGLSARALFC